MIAYTPLPYQAAPLRGRLIHVDFRKKRIRRKAHCWAGLGVGIFYMWLLAELVWRMIA